MGPRAFDGVFFGTKTVPFGLLFPRITKFGARDSTDVPISSGERPGKNDEKAAAYGAA
jgi:hypothetical protein